MLAQYYKKYKSISTVPNHKTLNKRLMSDAENAEYSESYQKNVMAKHSAWQTYSSNIAIIQNYVKDVITSIPGLNEQYWKDNCWNHIETWFSKYDHDEYAREHCHYPHAWGWVYFVNTPEGSSPLILSKSNTEIDAVAGKIVIFNAGINHHVPINKCLNRIVLAGNVGFDRNLHSAKLEMSM
tara:strand:+ start:44 stop:589 length:546 start_codon:yes stop_codon:yes gene_type:complete